MPHKPATGIFASLLLLSVVTLPFLGIYNRSELRGGIPLGLWGMLVVWGILLATLIFMARKNGDQP